MASTVVIEGKRSAHGLAWTLLIFLCMLGAAMAVRRGAALIHPPQRYPLPDLARLDARFVAQPVLTFAHIVPGFLFVLLVPLQFLPGIRARHPALHRWNGRVLLCVSVVAGMTALLLSLHPIGGILEASATLTFDALFLFSLARAYSYIRRRDVASHREWMLRAVSIALGIATVRPVMAVFVATSSRTHLTPHDYFGIAFWIGFTLNWIAGEMWIRRTRATPLSSATARS